MKGKFFRLRKISAVYFSFVLLISCSTRRQISRQANEALISIKELSSAHVGISVYDLQSQKYLYNYQANKYFVPASNTKLFTLYAGLKYLEDSIIAARIAVENGSVIIQATGDPTFLHPDFTNQPLLKLLQQAAIKSISINTDFASKPYGAGWAWDDFQDDYMAERDPFPMYGDVARVIYGGDSIRTIPPFLKQLVVGTLVKGKPWAVTRELGAHYYTIDTTIGTIANEKIVTMAMEAGRFATRNLADTLHKPVVSEYTPLDRTASFPVYSQPKDSLFRLMMHRSDNFFAEQTLLMASNERLGIMSDSKMIDTLLKDDFKELPQKPKWVDGSGLSRYNLFSPQDFIWLLLKLRAEFGIERLRVILAGANEGTLSGLYKGYDNYIFAKTGTLSNNIALSGYLSTKKNRQLVFSILINNHQSSSSYLRKQIEKFLTGIIDRS